MRSCWQFLIPKVIQTLRLILLITLCKHILNYLGMQTHSSYYYLSELSDKYFAHTSWLFETRKRRQDLNFHGWIIIKNRKLESEAKRTNSTLDWLRFEPAAWCIDLTCRETKSLVLYPLQYWTKYPRFPRMMSWKNYRYLKPVMSRGLVAIMS